MTERHEISGVIEETEEILEVLEYEKCSCVEGVDEEDRIFNSKLKLAIDHFEKALYYLRESEVMLSYYDHEMDVFESRNHVDVDDKDCVKDKHKIVVKQGDTLRFSFGIPSVAVKAQVVFKEGQLIAMVSSDIDTKEFLLRDLSKYVGEFIVDRPFNSNNTCGHILVD